MPTPNRSRMLPRSLPLTVARALTGAVLAGLLLALLPLQSPADADAGAAPRVGQARTGELPTPVRFPGNDGRPHTIAWDDRSLTVDGERLTVWSGEFHHWRLPSPDHWRDVLQKLKASGFNTVSLYFFWGLHSSQPGSYDFSGIRDIDRLLTMAEEEGLYVIARPGPYINAEVSMGGLPPYMTTHGGEQRTADPQNLAADLEWLEQVDAIISRHQLTDGGGSVLAYQVENEQIDNSAAHVEYIEKLQSAVEDHGITVPLFHNDWGDGHGYNVPGGPGGSRLDLYAFDTYPLGFDCAGERGKLTDFESRIRGYSPRTPVFIAEGQGGAFTAWGRDFQTEECGKFADPAFARQFAVNNLANGVSLFNSYMEYGGTNWGWTGDPGSGFTSYDYGAAIGENRTPTAKLTVHKEFGYLQRAVPALASATAAPDPESDYTGGGPVRVQQRVSTEDAARTSVTGHGTRLLTLRHPDSNDTSVSKATVRLDLSGGAGGAGGADGAVVYPRVPQEPGTGITVSGRDAEALVADHRFGGHRLVYSTSQLLTRLDRAGAAGDLLVLEGVKDEDGETVLRFDREPKVTALDGEAPRTTWDPARGDLRLNYRHGGTRTLRIDGGGRSLTVLLTDREAVARTWQLDSGDGEVLVLGPDLARTARVDGSRLDLTGDTAQARGLRVFGPPGVTTLTWNGHPVSAHRDPAGALVAELPGPRAVTTEPLTDWRTKDSDPERLPGFDDSAWKRADRTHADNPKHGPGPAAGVVLDTDEYGFHTGDVWYRGRYTTEAPGDSVTVTARTGTAGHALVWLNGHYLGSQGDGTTRHEVPPGVVEPGRPAVLSVLVRNMGHYLDWSSDGRSKTGRGLADVAVAGAEDVRWRIQGAEGGAAPADTARDMYNNGGLWGERQGWHLPGAPDGSWDHTDELSGDRAGVRWYRTTTELALPAGQDTALALRFEDEDSAEQAYRAQIFVNGWNTGQYVHDVGPQREFVIPPGFLDSSGTNTVALAVTSEEAGAGPGKVSLVVQDTVLGGPPVSVRNPAPDWDALHGICRKHR